MTFKTFSICMAFAFTVPAWAQDSSSNVTIYGILDQAVEHVHGDALANGKATSDWRVGFGEYASRLGFKGSEDLGAGLRAIFALEMGVTVDTGTAGQGRLFGRQSYAGLSGDWGTLTFGRQYAQRYYALFDADVYGAGSQGLGSIDPGIPNARVDNAIAYTGGWGRFSGGVNYSFGRDAVAGNNSTATNCPGESTDARQCREWSAMLKYEIESGGAKMGVVTAYERQNGGTAATYGGLTTPDKNDNRLTLNAYYRKDPLRLGMGWLKRINDGIATPTSNLYWLSGAVPVARNTVVDGMLAQINYDDSPNRARLYTLRASYFLSRRTVAYAGAAFIHNRGTLALPATANPPNTLPLPGGAQESLMVGMRHSF